MIYPVKHVKSVYTVLNKLLALSPGSYGNLKMGSKTIRPSFAG